MTELLRDPDKIIEDLLCPRGGLTWDIEDSIRDRAVAAVLCRLPERVYRRLARWWYTLQWFIPHELVGGEGMPFFVTHEGRAASRALRGDVQMPGGLKTAAFARVVYLSPLLERGSFDCAVAVVAHELAHVALRHALMTHPELYERQEAEAWRAVEEWGFGREARKRQAIYKRRDAAKRKRVLQLKRVGLGNVSEVKRVQRPAIREVHRKMPMIPGGKVNLERAGAASGAGRTTRRRRKGQS